MGKGGWIPVLVFTVGAALVLTSLVLLDPAEAQDDVAGSRIRPSDTSSSAGTPRSISSRKYLTQRRRVELSKPYSEWTKDDARDINERMANATAEEVIQWMDQTFKDKWGQVTSFGPTGMVILDMHTTLHKKLRRPQVPVVTVDTLHLFPETYQLIETTKKLYYPFLQLHTFRPRNATSREEFDAAYGAELWSKDPSRYGTLTKAEPTQRALAELQLQAWVTGRRRDQGGKRASLQLVEKDSGRIKVNPLWKWSYDDVWKYIKQHKLPYNSLLDQGYKSVGDTMTTQRTPPGGSERDGRFVGQAEKECGMHTLTPGGSVEVSNATRTTWRAKAREDKAKTWDAKARARADALGIVHLDASNFEELVIRGNAGKYLLVEMYAPWCGHCRALEPIFNKAASKLSEQLSDKLVILRMDVSANEVPVKAYQVSRFPTMWFAHPLDRSHPIVYNDERDADHIVQWVTNMTKIDLATFQQHYVQPSPANGHAKAV
eukprot:CAMPEP_0114249338 /NCGR_PEP_ID=MMETSP0058-20121206/14087_1 /TAXON_ID=36894 /ORGANISM="Pyramimonas parkeae, CCMP726" /LENGTH=488 /DNA_ID=CAMNT_0001362873 /DNA_START=273 /DNA_END=1739 /DNA_ORIENTATION=-